jgi:lysophospholipase L1-like esterase
MTKRRIEVTAWLVVVLAVLIFAVHGWLGSRANINAADAATTQKGFYLAIGGSSSLGFQPTGIPAHNGHRTSTGYANDLDATEEAKGISLTLRQVGCPGETAYTMMHAIDACYKGVGGQMTASLNYLKTNKGETGLVTIDLGFNDVRACLLGALVNVACADKGIVNVRQDMPAVLRGLKAAAGPNVKFVGLLYEDPFLEDYIVAGSGITQANLTLTVIGELNQALTVAYTAVGIPMANVPGAFKTAAINEVPLAGHGDVPQNVASACALTWMCHAPPWGPDDHPNNGGYRVIANAIAATLPKSW